MKKIFIEFKEFALEEGKEIEVNLFIDNTLRVKKFDLYSYVHWAEILDNRCMVYTSNKDFIERNDLPGVYHILPNPLEYFLIIEKDGERVVDKLKISQPEFWETIYNTKVDLSWA